jgi:serine/threonine-protein kinase
MMAKHLHEEPTPPSRRSELPVPAAFDRLVLDCLAKEPASRPATAGVLARSLTAIGGEPWGEREAAHWWAQHQPA